MPKTHATVTAQSRAAAEREYVQRFVTPSAAACAAADTRDAIDMMSDSHNAYLAVEILTSTISNDLSASILDDLNRNHLSALLRVLNSHFGEHLREAKQQAQRAIEQCH